MFRMVIGLAEEKAKVQEQEKKMVCLEVQLRLCSLFFTCLSLIIVSKADGTKWGTGEVRAGDEESC